MEHFSQRAFLLCLLAALLAVPAGTALWSRKDTAGTLTTSRAAPRC